MGCRDLVLLPALSNNRSAAAAAGSAAAAGVVAVVDYDTLFHLKAAIVSNELGLIVAKPVVYHIRHRLEGNRHG
jgi:hypothetical protein